MGFIGGLLARVSARGSYPRPLAPATRSVPRPSSEKRELRAGAVLLLLAALSLTACAPTQWVSIDLAEHEGAEPPVLFVDGEEWGAPPPTQLELRADRDHTLYFKQAGHRPELFVLESRETPSGPRLEPTVLRVRLRSLSDGERKVRVAPAPRDAATSP